jgi:hypothetical protein
MPKSVVGCATYPEYLLDAAGDDPEPESPSEQVWSVCEESGQAAQSKQRRFRRNLANRRINLAGVHPQLMRQALSPWVLQRLYLSLDTTMLWNCFCVV